MILSLGKELSLGLILFPFCLYIAGFGHSASFHCSVCLESAQAIACCICMICAQWCIHPDQQIQQTVHDKLAKLRIVLNYAEVLI